MPVTSPGHNIEPDENMVSNRLFSLSKPLNTLGRVLLKGINDLGAATIFCFQALASIFKPKQIPKIAQQTYQIGTRSVVIILLVGFFTGMVLGLQSYHALVRVGAVGALGTLVALSLIRELAPVLTAIMVTARAGSAMAAEIGILRISEQIDALKTMRIDPVRFLISPRIAASLISLPILVTFFNIIGIIGGYVSGVVLMGADGSVYIHRVHASIEMDDIVDGMIKSVVFALIVATVCCYQGYFTHLRTDSRGAKAVGMATTSAVVVSCVLILVANYIVTSLII